MQGATFSDQVGGRCRAVTAAVACKPGQRPTAATTSTDRQCAACAAQQFSPSGAACTTWTTCSAGSQTSLVAPTSSTDRTCSPCPANTYNDRPNKRCAPCVVGVSFFPEPRYRAAGACQFVSGLTYLNVKFRFTDAFPTTNSTLALFRSSLLARLQDVLTGSRQNLEITSLQSGSIVVRKKRRKKGIEEEDNFDNGPVYPFCVFPRCFWMCTMTRCLSCATLWRPAPLICRSTIACTLTSAAGWHVAEPPYYN